MIDKNGVVPDIKAMTDDELKKRVIDLPLEMARVKEQIARAKARGAQGDYSDHDWYHRVHHALRFMGADHQAILRELNERSKKRKAAEHEATMQRNRHFERNFIIAARKLIPEGLYMSVITEAQTMTEAPHEHP